MENKKENPKGVCEKLFNVFNVNNPAFRPLRRLTFKNQEPPPTTTTAPNQSPPQKPTQLDLQNNNNHHHHHDTPISLIPLKTTTESQQITTPPPPKKPLDAVQVQVPSKIEIQNQEGKAHRSTTTTKKEEATPPSMEKKVSNVVVTLQGQLPVPTAPAPATVAGRRQPQRLETKNIDGKTDDFINRVRNKLKSTGSNVGAGAGAGEGGRKKTASEVGNDGKVDDFINRVGNKIRNGSNVGRAPTSN